VVQAAEQVVAVAPTAEQFQHMVDRMLLELQDKETTVVQVAEPGIQVAVVVLVLPAPIVLVTAAQAYHLIY
jgi:hypothetical protein